MSEIFQALIQFLGVDVAYIFVAILIIEQVIYYFPINFTYCNMITIGRFHIGNTIKNEHFIHRHHIGFFKRKGSFCIRYYTPWPIWFPILLVGYVKNNDHVLHIKTGPMTLLSVSALFAMGININGLHGLIVSMIILSVLGFMYYSFMKIAVFTIEE